MLHTSLIYLFYFMVELDTVLVPISNAIVSVRFKDLEDLLKPELLYLHANAYIYICFLPLNSS